MAEKKKVPAVAVSASSDKKKALETALQQIDEAIGLDRGNLMYSYIKAGIKKDQEKYEEALSIYRLCESDYDETSHFYANVGECLYQLRRFEEALPNLKKSVKGSDGSGGQPGPDGRGASLCGYDD